MRIVLSLLVLAASTPALAASRDPFRSPFHDRPAVAKATALESFDVDDFVLEGIVTGVAEPHAVLRTPAGEAILVRRGTLVGLHGGRIVRITNGELVVAESTSLDGAVISRERALRVAE